MTALTSPKLVWGADCISASIDHLPVGVPVIWPYLTGSASVRWTSAQAAKYASSIQIWVNQGFNSPGPLVGTEFDIERGAWTVNDVVDITEERQAKKMVTTAYVTWDDYGHLKEGLAEIGIDRNVYYRIADWNLDQHLADAMLHGDIYAGQWASPTSNPRTLVPGTSTPLATANLDLNVVFLPLPGWQG